MTIPFLAVFPREIRDQIYCYVLANPHGHVRLYPWTTEIARSLTVLRTCKQVFRECKDIIWEHNKLNIRDQTELYGRFQSLSNNGHMKRIQHVKICIELLDRDELEWMSASLKALLSWVHAGYLQSITLVTNSDRPRTVEEFREALVLREMGETIDGRLYKETATWTKMLINTGWPRFSHWGKQSWLREMLLDPSGIDDLVRAIHEYFGGALYIDGSLCFKDWEMVGRGVNLNPRDGEIRIVPSPRSLRHGNI